MFFQAVEEYVLHDRQRKLAKDLGFKRQLQISSDNTIVTGLYLLLKVAGQLRHLACRSESATASLLGCAAH